jgi:hypothetical protein
MDTIKTENSVDVLSEDSFIGMRTDEVCVPSALSLRKAEAEVSYVFR